MIKKYILTLTVVAATLLTASCGDGEKTQEAPAMDTVPTLVMQIRKCSKLYTAECKVRKIVTHEDEKRLQGRFFNQDVDIALPLGSRKIAIPMDVTLKAYIDFSGFSSNNISRQGGKITVTLPDPEIVLTASRIDHDGIKRHVPMLRGEFTDAELTSYEQQGRRAVLQNIPATGITEQARESAATILIPLIERMGYAQENITVTFRKDYRGADPSSVTILKDTESHGKKD